MPRMVHLNGPAGVGKSTIARMYVERHPGALNLDTDHIVSQIGGWRENFWESVVAARLLAVSMAGTHLRQGKDVIWPQVASQAHEVEGAEGAARDAGAEYDEIILMTDKDEALKRFAARSASGSVTVHQRGVDAVVADHGGPVLLARIYDHISAFLQTRPNCTVIDTSGKGPEQTYDEVSKALSARG